MFGKKYKHQVTEQSLENMRLIGVSDQIINRLEKLKDKGVYEQPEFIMITSNILGEDFTHNKDYNNILVFTRISEQSSWNAFFEILKSNLSNQTIVIAIITTIFGSFAVAFTTSYVTQKLGERELQWKVMTELMNHTETADLNEPMAINRLSALTQLIDENEQFSIKVAGFQKIVDNYHENELKEANVTISNLQKELQQTGLDQDERNNLQKKLNDSIQEKDEIQKNLSSDRSKILLLEKELATTKENLNNLQVSSANMKIDLSNQIDQLNRQHLVKIQIITNDTSKSIISIIFSNSQLNDGNHEWFNGAITDFSFPGELNRFTIERNLRDISFMDAKFIRLINLSSDGWDGNIVISVDGAEKLKLTVSDDIDKANFYQMQL